MKAKYENTIKILKESNEDFAKFIDSIINGMPKGLVSKIDSYKSNGRKNNEGYLWEYTDQGGEFNLIIDKEGTNIKNFVDFTVIGLEDDELIKWRDVEEETNIATLNVWIHNKNFKEKKMKLNYEFYLKMVDGKYVVVVKSKNNSCLKEKRELLESSEFLKIHEKIVGLNYTFDVKKITGKERKTNKLNIHL